MHNHENKQVCIRLERVLTLYNEDGESVVLEEFNSVWLDS